MASSHDNGLDLHKAVWDNNPKLLRTYLESKEFNVEQHDTRGRTPLHLAVSLGHLECVKLLLRNDANANSENSDFWTALHEATCTGDPEIVTAVLQYRDYQRIVHRSDGVPALLRKLREAPDFYVEMTWEFTSWVPLVARMCPSDTYKVYKSGSMVRIDTTLLGFDNNKWEKGSRSYIFKLEENSAKLLEVNHDAGVVYSETIQEFTTPPSVDLLLPSADQVSMRLTSPVATSFVNTDKISFERAKTGVWGFRSDKNETVNGHDCKVFNATNVQFITKTRTEHLSTQDKQAIKKNKSSSPIENFLGLAEKHTEKSPMPAANVDMHNPCCITSEEYFSDVSLGERDIGRPREIHTKIQKFKANLSLCEEYPLTLQQQVLPIIDLMAASNAHFRKLKDFITLQLPAGFPVKIEIPIFHVLNAKITFGNIFASDTAVDKVSVIRETRESLVEDEILVEEVATSCAIDPLVFSPPEGYRLIGESHHQDERYLDQDDQLLQFAIQQSLLEGDQPSDNLSLVEALNTFHPANNRPAELDYDAQLALALSLSKEQTSTHNDLALREQEELERILALSLTDK